MDSLRASMWAGSLPTTLRFYAGNAGVRLAPCEHAGGRDRAGGRPAGVAAVPRWRQEGSIATRFTLTVR